MFDLVGRVWSILRLRKPDIGTLAVGAKRLGRDRNHQVVPGPNHIAAQIVRRANRSYRRVVLQRDLGNCLVVADLVALPAHAFVGRHDGQRRAERVGDRDGHDEAVRAMRIGRPAVVARVEGIHGVDIDTGELGRQRQVDLRAGVHDHKLWLVADIG